MVGKRRIVNLKVLPGQPTNGTGRICVHLFIQDEAGTFVEPCAIHPVFKDGVQVKQMVSVGPTRGRLACDPRRSVAPFVRGGVTIVTVRTDDPRSVSCPKCLASAGYAAAMAKLTAATTQKH